MILNGEQKKRRWWSCSRNVWAICLFVCLFHFII